MGTGDGGCVVLSTKAMPPFDTLVPFVRSSAVFGSYRNGPAAPNDGNPAVPPINDPSLPFPDESDTLRGTAKWKEAT